MGKTYISGSVASMFRRESSFTHDGCRVGFKSPATISLAQQTAQYDGTPGVLAAKGRHDPCVVPRAVPIVEAMASIVVMDLLLVQNSRKAASALLLPVTTLPATMVMPPLS